MIENFLVFAFSLNAQKNIDIAKNDILNINIEKNRVVDFITQDNSYFKIQKINKESIGVQNKFKSGIIYDYNNGKIYWKKNENEKRSIASLTKIMTTLVFLDLNVDLNKYIVIEKEDIKMDVKDAAIAGFLTDDKILVRDLLYSGYIGSKNDAINLLVKSTGLTIKEFVQKMNEKAKNLEMNDSTFTNINGLDPGNISTAHDLAKLAYIAFSNSTIQKLSKTKDYTFKTFFGNVYSIKNTDKLLSNNNFNVIAAKTGYLDEALYCFTLLSNKDNRKLVSVLLGNETEEERFSNAEELTTWVYKNWK